LPTAAKQNPETRAATLKWHRRDPIVLIRRRPRSRTLKPERNCCELLSDTPPESTDGRLPKNRRRIPIRSKLSTISGGNTLRTKLKDGGRRRKRINEGEGGARKKKRNRNRSEGGGRRSEGGGRKKKRKRNRSDDGGRRSKGGRKKKRKRKRSDAGCEKRKKTRKKNNDGSGSSKWRGEVGAVRTRTIERLCYFI